MVLESLVDPTKAEHHPRKMVWYGFLYTTVAIFVGWWVFYTYASMIFVFLAAIAAVPLMYNTIKYEEKKDLQLQPEKILIKEHGKALSFFMYLFIGMTLAGVVWYVVLPSEMTGALFESQMSTINAINGGVTGLAFGEQMSAFTRIFLNNVKVMIFCALFSLLYGAGAIFILSWNASVISAAIGNSIRGNLASYAHLAGFERLAQYLNVISVGLLKYVIHGVPEILAYFTAGLAGGIISIAIIRHDFGTKKFEHIVLDSADLFLLSVGLLAVAAVLEVWVTPLIF